MKEGFFKTVGQLLSFNLFSAGEGGGRPGDIELILDVFLNTNADILANNVQAGSGQITRAGKLTLLHKKTD